MQKCKLAEKNCKNAKNACEKRGEGVKYRKHITGEKIRIEARGTGGSYEYRRENEADSKREENKRR